MRTRRRLRLGVLMLVSLLLLAALPVYFGIRANANDPVFDSLDELAVPGWGAIASEDAVSGNRWCWIDCRLRERTSQSEREPDETNQVYVVALSDAGWRPWQAPLCPEAQVEGHYSCWKRDELTLDLWVRKPTCAVPTPTDVPLDGQVQPPPAAGPDCVGSQVSIKVRNAVDDDRTRPQPTTDPSLTGVDPDPLLTDDPLQDLTPSPS
ncbi:hypothetical protein [Plantactinospora sp. GCM10030261]|uniref:hypothetical protein n=1 Tax=Plantactinospora sp. GCM10030261 TaxID=3273420 RepID=UPI003620F9FF